MHEFCFLSPTDQGAWGKNEQRLVTPALVPNHTISRRGTGSFLSHFYMRRGEPIVLATL